MKSQNKTLTQSKLAAILGTTRQNIAHHVKAGKAPKDLADIDAWQSYLAVVGRDGTVPKELRESMAKEKLGILRAIRHDKERANKIKDGEVFDAANVTRFVTDLVHNCFFGELDRLAHEFPSTLKGKDEVAIHEEILRETESVKRTLRNKLDAFAAATPKSNEKGKQ